MRLDVLCRLLALSLFLGVASAEAAVPVVLPPTESPAAWASALAVGDLALGPAGSGASVTIVAGKDAWILRVMDQRGNVQELNVLPPAGVQDREDMLWLATDLLKQAGAFLAPTPVPVAVPVAPAKPVAPPSPVAPAKPVAPPAPVAPAKPVAPPAPVAPAKPVAPPAPVAPSAPVAPPAPAAPAKPVAPTRPAPGDRAPTPVSWWAELGAGAGMRSATATGLDLRLGGGAQLGANLGLGLTVNVRPASQIEGLGEGRTVSTSDLGLGAWWSFGGARVQTLVGASLGVARQGFRESGDSVGSALVPYLGAEVGVDVPLAAGLSLRPLVSAHASLRPVAIETPSTTVDLGRVEPRAVVALSYRPAPSTQ